MVFLHHRAASADQPFAVSRSPVAQTCVAWAASGRIFLSPRLLYADAAAGIHGAQRALPMLSRSSGALHVSVLPCSRWLTLASKYCQPAAGWDL